MPQYKEEVNDFGFSFEDETFGELEKAVVVATTEKDQYEYDAYVWKWRATMLRNKIEGLLQNLEANPEKDMIRWPNRAQAVNDFRGQLEYL